MATIDVTKVRKLGCYNKLGKWYNIKNMQFFVISILATLRIKLVLFQHYILLINLKLF